MTAKSSRSALLDSQHGVRRRVAWSSDCGQQLSTVFDEVLDDVPTVDTDIIRNSHIGETSLRNNTGDFGSETDLDVSDPVILSQDLRERRADKTVSSTSRNQKVSFIIECDEDDTAATSSQSDVEMSDVCDRDDSNNRN